VTVKRSKVSNPSVGAVCCALGSAPINSASDLVGFLDQPSSSLQGSPAGAGPLPHSPRSPGRPAVLILATR
jgi:hypothetical protein